MRKIIWIAHISLDGYVANKEGRLDDFESGEENLAFVTEICNEADTILSGRITHEMLDSFWPDAGTQPGATQAEKKYSEWYNSANKVVATRATSRFKKQGVAFVHDHLPRFVQQARLQPGKPMVVFGSTDVAGQLMEQNLIDIYWIFINPVIFGGGIPLFKNSNSPQKLRLCETKRFANGETALKYMVGNSSKS